MSEEEIILDGREERRTEWINILKDCLNYHLHSAQELRSPIIGAPESEECIMHQVWAHSIKDAVGLIELLPLIEEDNKTDDKEVLPQHHQGPLG
tara:strand:- start:4128 stop:4409 length:282 start_codon:yes stop_codon:yes gene_type:complete